MERVRSFFSVRSAEGTWPKPPPEAVERTTRTLHQLVAERTQPMNADETRRLALDLQAKAAKAKEVAPDRWHHATNRHSTTDGRPWGAMELKAHPAGGAGTALFTWEGADRAELSRYIAAADPTTIATLTSTLLRYQDALKWLTALDEPGNPERKTVTLNAIIQRAAAALEGEDR